MNELAYLTMQGVLTRTAILVSASPLPRNYGFSAPHFQNIRLFWKWTSRISGFFGNAPPKRLVSIAPR